MGNDAPRNDAPRLGDTAFRAQREALEHAEVALKKLAAQAHGEAIGQVLTAWETRDAAKLPSVQELGNRTNAATRTAWTQALAKPAINPDSQAIPTGPPPPNTSALLMETP